MIELFYLFILIVTVGFSSSLFLTKVWIKIASKAKLLGKDMNKYSKPLVPEAGGIAFVIGYTFSILIYIFLKTFYLSSISNIVEIFAVLVTILLAGFLGFVDDILGWKKGLKQWQKPLLTIPIAIPLVVINAGNSTITLPFFGSLDMGILYSLILVPIGVIGASNGFNMLAGYNGLEASMGIIILATLGIFAFSQNILWLTTIIFSAVFSLLGFLFYNKYPSKVFPGDSLTYSVGALIASIAILGNMESVALFLFLPYFIELLIKAKNKFKTECFGIPQKNGSLKPPRKIGSLTHIILKFFGSELKVYFSLILIEMFISLAIIISYLFILHI